MATNPFKRYERFIGRLYKEPHGCFYLVQDVYEEEYQETFLNYAKGLAGNDPVARAAIFSKAMVHDFKEVGTPREGDIVVINVATRPWHMGIVVKPGWMLHTFNGANACFERYTDLKYRNRVEGFYRRV